MIFSKVSSSVTPAFPTSHSQWPQSSTHLQSHRSRGLRQRDRSIPTCTPALLLPEPTSCTQVHPHKRPLPTTSLHQPCSPCPHCAEPQPQPQPGFSGTALTPQVPFPWLVPQGGALAVSLILQTHHRVVGESVTKLKATTHWHGLSPQRAETFVSSSPLWCPSLLKGRGCWVPPFQHQSTQRVGNGRPWSASNLLLFNQHTACFPQQSPPESPATCSRAPLISEGHGLGTSAALVGVCCRQVNQWNR